MGIMAVVDNSDFCNYPTGGQLTSIINFLNYITQGYHKNIEVVLIGITRKKEEVGRLIDIEISEFTFKFLPVVWDSSSPNNPRESVRKLFMKGILLNRKAINRLQVDLFYIHTPEAYVPLKLYFPRVKFAVFSHGNFFDIYNCMRFEKYKNHWIKLITTQLFNFILKTADMVFVLDERTLIKYKKLCKKVFKVYNSIDTGAFKREFEYTDSRKIKVLYVGRLSANKNVDKIIDAFFLLEDCYELDIIGDGEEFDKLKKLILELGLDNRVKLSGKKTHMDIIKDYISADILVLNSSFEGLPMVILEAMASGLCILTTEVGAIGDIVKDGIHGYYINGTSKSIVDKIHESRGKLHKFYINNTEEVKKYDYMNVNLEITEKLDELLNGDK